MKNIVTFAVIAAFALAGCKELGMGPKATERHGTLEGVALCLEEMNGVELLEAQTARQRCALDLQTPESTLISDDPGWAVLERDTRGIWFRATLYPGSRQHIWTEMQIVLGVNSGGLGADLTLKSAPLSVWIEPQPEVDVTSLIAWKAEAGAAESYFFENGAPRWCGTSVGAPCFAHWEIADTKGLRF